MKTLAVSLGLLAGALSTAGIAAPTGDWRAAHEQCANVLVVGDFKGAEPLCTKAMAIAEASGDRTANVLSLQKLSELYVDSKQAQKAEASLKREVAYHEKAFGPAHSSTAQVLMRVGDFYRKAKKKNEARAAYKRALDINTSALGPTDPATNMARNRLEDLGS